MNIEIQQLGDIYTELTNQFGNDSVIQIVPTKGQPPEQYEVTFDLPCTIKSADGSIQISRGHTVIIAIPFGFPHFPPSCKPKSPIFHPDFDDAAICLGDFWQHSHNLTELIHYIGTMLSGEVYSRHNAFNAEAAEWYRQNSDQLPFQLTNFHLVPTPLTQPQETVHHNDADHLELDVLEEADLAPHADASPNGLAAETTSALETTTSSLTPATDKLWFLARKKRYFQLRQELDSLSSTDTIEGLEILNNQTDTALSEAQDLALEATSQEELGSPESALHLYQTLIGLVADYPDAAAAIKRLQAVLATTKAASPSDRRPQPSSARTGPKVNGQEGAAANGASSGKTKKQANQTVWQLLSANIVAVAVAGSLLCFVAISGYLYATYSAELTKAETLLGDCNQFMTKQNFPAAEKACLAALDTAKGVLIFHQTASSAIKKESQGILASETMLQGLRGNVLLNGSYVPVKSVQHQTDFQLARDAGKKYLKDAQWQKASDSLAKALEIFKAHPTLTLKDIKEVERDFNFSQFRLLFQQAEQLYAENLPGKALPLVLEAQKKLSELESATQDEFALPIEELRSKCQFAELKTKTAALLANADWQKAYALSQEALELGKKLPTVGPQDLENLRTTMARAELYSTIEEGNTAFSAEKWDLALERFKNASDQLARNDAEFSAQDLDKNRQKLDRIILQSTVIKIRQEAETAQAAKNIGQTIALLQDILTVIKDSKYSHDPEIHLIAEEINKKIKPLQEEKVISDKIGYLTENYQDLFLKNYPETTKERLSAPQITFMKKIGARLLFQLKCVDTDGGRKLTLVMFYIFDPADGSWNFYSET